MAGSCVLAVVLLLTVVSTTVASPITSYGDHFWVVARPANYSGFVHQETHALACNRVGLKPTASGVWVEARDGVDGGPSSHVGWNVTALDAVVAGLGDATSIGVAGCCASSMWCSPDPSNPSDLECLTYGEGGQYLNFGWTTNTAQRPVYTCTNDSSFAGVAGSVQVGNRTAVISSPRSTVTIDGNGFGTEASDVVVQIGQAECTDVTLCNALCARCTVSADCGEGLTCTRFSDRSTGTTSDRFCIRTCNSDGTCPCGGQCVAFQADTNYCLNPGWGTSLGAICNTSLFNWGPPPSSGFDSRIDCTSPTAGYLECPAAGPQQLSVSVAGVEAVPVAPLLSASDMVVSFGYNECTSDDHCGGVTLCHIPYCDAGCCKFRPSGRCETPPTTSIASSFLAKNYVVLNALSASALTVPEVTAADERSGVSDVDDSPYQRVPLEFEFEFYSAPYTQLSIGANGLLATSHDAPCGGTFMGVDCDFSSEFAYRGIIAPLLTDLNPSASSTANVYFRSSETEFCVGWLTTPLWSTTPSASDQRYTTYLCIYPGGAMRWRFDGFPHAPEPTQQWLSGIRSPDSQPSSDEDAVIDRYFAASTGSDIAYQTPLEILFSDQAVMDNNTAGVCSHNNLGCMEQSCGPAGTEVTIRWDGIDCGPGITLSFSCFFGSEEASGVFGTDDDGGFLKCAAPPQPSFRGDDLPVVLTVVLRTPVGPSTNTSGPNRGVGPHPEQVNSDREVLTSMDVKAVLSRDLLDPASRRRRLSGLSRNLRRLEVVPADAVVHDMLFTYTTSGATCGCDLTPGSVCDPCGVCGGSNSTRDCAGVCFGSAVVDDCGVCAGGTTGLIVNADKDCEGVCGGRATCNLLPPVETAPIVVIVALACCLVALFSMCLWFVRVSILQRRRTELFELEMAAMAPPGMTEDGINALALKQYKPVEGADTDTCAVCLMDMEEGDEYRDLTCKHFFHTACLDEWLVRSVQCPMCKADLRGPAGGAADGSGGGSADELVAEGVQPTDDRVLTPPPPAAPTAAAATAAAGGGPGAGAGAGAGSGGGGGGASASIDASAGASSSPSPTTLQATIARSGLDADSALSPRGPWVSRMDEESKTDAPDSTPQDVNHPSAIPASSAVSAPTFLQSPNHAVADQFVDSPGTRRPSPLREGDI